MFLLLAIVKLVRLKLLQTNCLRVFTYLANNENSGSDPLSESKRSIDIEAEMMSVVLGQGAVSLLKGI